MLPAGAEPHGVDISLDGSVAYIPSRDLTAPEDAVYVIDLATQSVVDAVEMNAVEPNALAIHPTARHRRSSPMVSKSDDTNSWGQG